MLESMTNTQQLLSCQLSVSFDGEQGVDVSGLTNEFISLFWKTLSSNLMYGAKELCIEGKPDFLCDSVDYEIFERLFVHGYILTGYLSIHLNNAALYHVLIGRKPSKDVLKSSIFNRLSRTDQDL